VIALLSPVTVTASRAASLTSFLSTDTSYVAPAAPNVSPAFGATVAIFVSPAAAVPACTFSTAFFLELSSNKFLVKDANGDIRQEVETKFLPDEFGILPITAEKDFSNDIVERVKEFVKFVYGEESLKDNLNFIAEALGNKDNKNPEEIIRTYFIKDFYADHLQRYQKRPIYWLTNSGKKNALSCLFYIHRYEPLTIARVRADYLIPYQEMLENERKFIERQLYDEDISAKEKKNVEKELKDLDILLKELREYANEVKHIAEQKITLDLDDGVNVNYEKLEAILKKR